MLNVELFTDRQPNMNSASFIFKFKQPQEYYNPTNIKYKYYNTNINDYFHVMANIKILYYIIRIYKKND